MNRRLRRILDRTDTRAPASAEWASEEFRRRAEQQQRIAAARMAEHDAQPGSVRAMDTIVGNVQIAQALVARGYAAGPAAEAAVRRLMQVMR
jgi:hypothetical protein